MSIYMLSLFQQLMFARLLLAVIICFRANKKSVS